MFLFGLSLFRFLRFFLRQPCHLICGGIIRLIVNDHHALGGFTVKPEETFLMQPRRVCPRDPFGWTFHEDATKWTKIVSLAFARYASADETIGQGFVFGSKTTTYKGCLALLWLGFFGWLWFFVFGQILWVGFFLERRCRGTGCILFGFCRCVCLLFCYFWGWRFFYFRRHSLLMYVFFGSSNNNIVGGGWHLDSSRKRFGNRERPSLLKRIHIIYKQLNLFICGAQKL
mmetsp:Transcript_8464/g.16189  ORF Transcript_8464/g.16189 Transcript_8464/m.16189 type:complete len:229 (-) Transcript_8464:171-857(-)